MDKIRTAASKQISEVLTADQQSAFKKMQGKPFNLASLAPGAGNPTRSSRTDGPDQGTDQARSRRGASDVEPGMDLQPGADEPQ